MDPRRHRPQGRRHALRARAVTAAAGVVVAATLLVAGGIATGAGTANSTVAVTVASATSINAAGCASGTANVTDFGTVLPATSNVTSADCTVVFGSSNDTSMLRAYQTDTTGSAMFGMSNGSLDTTFDSDGMQSTPVGTGLDEAKGLAIQADGKIVLVGGVIGAGGWQDWGIVRYTSGGVLDTTFDTDGKLITSIGGNNDYANAVAIQPDGKIVVAGDFTNGAQKDFAVARYNTDGSLDTTFDTDGMVTTPVLAGADIANAVTIQADGKIVLEGNAHNGANNDFAVVRYNPNGSLDTTFDTDGKVTSAVLAGNDFGKAATIQADGKIVVAGYAHNGADFDFAVVRFNADGSLDTSFDTDGKQTTAIGSSDDVPNGIVLQPDGKIVLAGYSTIAGVWDFSAVRYSSNGALDVSFDADGKVTTDFGNSDSGQGVAIQLDGRIIVGGYANNGASNDFALVRYGTSGSLDTTFSGDGKTTTTFPLGYSMATSVALQTDGKIVAAGRTNNGANDDYAVARYAGGGSVADWGGSWGAANLFGACLHTVANATNTWVLAGSGNCTTAIDANWNALPVAASKIAYAGSGVTNATANLRYGFKAAASQQAGTYVAPLTFEVVAPNA